MRFRRGTGWLVRSLYFPVFLQIRNLPSPVSRSQAHTHLLVPAARFPRPGPDIAFFEVDEVGGNAKPAKQLVQFQMLRRLSEIYGVPFSENRGKSIIASLVGAV